MHGNRYWLSRANHDGARRSMPFLTPRELGRFHAMRESGQISVFHVGRCENCGREIPKVEATSVIGDPEPIVVRWCSKECFDKSTG